MQEFFCYTFFMDYKIFFSVIAFLIGITSSFFYIRDIFRDKTQPHSYTFLIWTITQGTAAAGAFYGHGGYGAINLSIGAFVNFFIFLLSLKYGTKNINVKDKIALAAAFCAIIIWLLLDNPLLAVILVSIIDVIGYLPSFRKTYYEPWSETQNSWIGFTVANILAILALSQYNLLTLSYILAITACNVVMAVICILRRPFVKKPN